MATLAPLGNATSAQPAPTGDQLLGVKRSSSSYGDDVNAALSLAEWDRYKAYYQPLEDILFGMADDPNGRQNAMNTAAQMSTNRFDEAGDAFQRQARGLGLQLTEGQQQSYDRRQDVSAGLSRVGAANTAGRNYDALRRMILGGA